MPGEPIRSLPVACALTPDQLRSRRDDLLTGLASRATGITPLGHGYQILFPADDEVLSAIVAVINAERTCCPFLQFDLSVPPGGGDVALRITGPEGTQTFLEGLLNS